MQDRKTPASKADPPAQASREELPRDRRWWRNRFLWVALAVLTGAHLYVAQRLIAPAGLGSTGSTLAWAIALSALAAVPLSIGLRWARRPAPWTARWYRAHMTFLGLLFMALTLLVLRDTVWLVGAVAGLLPRAACARAMALCTSNAAIVGIVAVLGVYARFMALRVPPLRRVSVPIEGLPAALDGLTIAQVSDLHVGATIKAPFVESVVARVAAAEPDLIAITGDLVDGAAADLADDVAPLARLTAPLGVYFVPGNHDYYSDLAEWTGPLEALGLTVLINGHRTVRDGQLVVAGATDPTGARFGPEHRPDPARALAETPPAAIRLLLAHQPVTALQARGLGVHLQLSGHTHGGQIVPFGLLVMRLQPYLAGLYETGDGWIYVSRGTGFWGPPLRLGAPSEITLLTLTTG